MATTLTSLFIRPKSLGTILGGFAKTARDLDAFIQEADADIDGFTTEISKLAAGRSAAESEKAQAIRARAKVADFLGA